VRRAVARGAAPRHSRCTRRPDGGAPRGLGKRRSWKLTESSVK
jgi:hypothetical protein